MDRHWKERLELDFSRTGSVKMAVSQLDRNPPDHLRLVSLGTLRRDVTYHASGPENATAIGPGRQLSGTLPKSSISFLLMLSLGIQ